MVTDAFMGIWASGLAAGIEAAAMSLGRHPADDELEGLTWGLYEQGKQVTGVQYQLAVAMLQLASRQVAQFHQSWDVWLTPTLGAPPVRNGVLDMQERDPEKALAPIIDYVPFTPIQNATGQPAVSLPLYWTDDGLPVGTMFAGRFGDEATLFRLAGQLEKARPWAGRKPPVWD